MARAKGGAMGRTDIEGLIEDYGAALLALARRWSLSVQDAEDAFQRAAELALTKRPDGSPEELRAWLRTTVRNEALAIVRQRRRTVAGGSPESLAGRRMFSPQTAPDTDVRAEQLERLRLGSQALRRLKSQEIRALQLQAEGYSYREIAATTGWTATKVNRCLTEGRRAFERAMDGLDSGAECRRLAADLDAVVAGESSPEQRAALRRHLATCLTCRSRLRGQRASGLHRTDVA